MHELFASKKVIWVFLTIAGVAILVILITVLVARTRTAPLAQNANQNTAPFERTDVPAEQLPDRFPADLPQENNAKVVENFNSTTNDGTYQATRSYISARTPADNYRAFTTYFRTNGWTTLTTNDGTVTKSITAKKDDTTIQALFYTTIDEAKASTVKVNVTIAPPASPAN